MSKKIIEFIPVGDVFLDYYPIPARQNLPEWYKNQKSYIGDNKIPMKEDGTSATIKKCIPVFDALTTGYLIRTVADLYVWHDIDENGKVNKYYRWGAGQPIEFHGNKQFDSHPVWNEMAFAPKFINSFIIKTPRGYSCLFTAPLGHIAPFKIVDGVVDTDNYYNPINFPFVFTEKEFEGEIPAGTPIAQVIPFKRDKWTMKITNPKMYEQEINQTKLGVLNGFFDNYKRKFWFPKEYK